jgi:hypothetical protein
MKPLRTGRLLGLAMLTAVIVTFPSAHVNAVVGYVNSVYGIGDTLIANPLEGEDTNAVVDNTLDNVMPTAPMGATISLWNPSADQFTTASTFGSSGWSVDLTLAPGTGALLYTPALFTNTWVGVVLNFDGSVFQGTLTTPPRFTGANGVYLRSSAAPVELTGTNVFLDILGRGPLNGEQVITMNSQGQESATTFENGLWSNGMPDVQIGHSAFLNVGPVPEPSSARLGMIGAAALLGAWFSRRQNKRRAAGGSA